MDDERLKAIIHRDLYVDDLVTGTNNLNEALELTRKPITLFEKPRVSSNCKNGQATLINYCPIFY